jgi:hypothetical protein
MDNKVKCLTAQHQKMTMMMSNTMKMITSVTINQNEFNYQRYYNKFQNNIKELK